MLRQLRAYRVTDERILNTMARVRRHVYIPEQLREKADPYGDHPCPIGHGQTISQPYIVAYMTERMELKQNEKVLEIGTGSGYQAAVLAEMGVDVFTIEIVPDLADHAGRALKDEGYDGAHVITGDGYQGLPEHAPFDAIIVTCAPEEVPPALTEQLKEGGRMILPMGTHLQHLVILRKQNGRVMQKHDIAVRFVPMVHGSARIPGR